MDTDVVANRRIVFMAYQVTLTNVSWVERARKFHNFLRQNYSP